jgi:hypothetical protein
MGSPPLPSLASTPIWLQWFCQHSLQAIETLSSLQSSKVVALKKKEEYL